MKFLFNLTKKKPESMVIKKKNSVFFFGCFWWWFGVFVISCKRSANKNKKFRLTRRKPGDVS